VAGVGNGHLTHLTRGGRGMAKKQKFPPNQYMKWNTEDSTDPYTEVFDSLQSLMNSGVEEGETIEVAVYKLETVIKVKNETAYKIVK
jgi:hypothetical protein